jgi:hypothetical protein
MTRIASYLFATLLVIGGIVAPTDARTGALHEWLSGIDIELRLGRTYISSYDVAVDVAFRRMLRGSSLERRPTGVDVLDADVRDDGLHSREHAASEVQRVLADLEAPRPVPEHGERRSEDAERDEDRRGRPPGEPGRIDDATDPVDDAREDRRRQDGAADPEQSDAGMESVHRTQ